MNVKTRSIDEKGRVTIPKEYLEKMGINEYHDLFIYLKGDQIIISHNFHPEFSSSSIGERDLRKDPSTRRKEKIPPKRKPGSRRSPAVKTEKFNEKWAYEQRKKGLSLQKMADEYEKEMGRGIDRGALSRWIKEYREGLSSE